jgi:hypothetical protein
MKDVMKSVSDFDEAISKLDSLIAKGWARYKLSERAFTKAAQENNLSKLDGLNISKEHFGEHNVWFEEVRHNIEKLTDRNYYWVLLINFPRNNGTWVEGLGPDLSNFLINFESELKVLSNILIMLEERRGTVIRQEIAKQEYDASTKYELRYSNSRELTFNGIPLARPDFLSENDQFLTFIFADGNSWRNVPMSELLDSMKIKKLGKTIHQILNDLNITGVIKDVFIPNASAKGFEFRNPISHGYADDNKLPIIDIKTIRNSKK